MKRFAFRIAAITSAVAMTATLLAGCGKTPSPTSGNTTTAAKPAEPVKLTWFANDFNRVLKDGDPIIKEAEKQSNTKLEFTLVPSSEYKTKLNMLVASNSLPDITRVNGYDIFQYIPQGVFIEVNGLVDKHGPNIKKFLPKDAWAGTAYNGKNYGVPSINSQGKYNLFIRKDWLENLGLKAPTNLDELSDILKKFTFNDPDKNGQNDTYGFSSDGPASGDNPETSLQPLFGAFGIIPKQYYLKGDKFYAASTMPEYKAALEYINKLYTEKVVDPDFFVMKSDQARQKLAQGKAGVSVGWWSLGPQILIEQLKMNQINPNAKWDIINEIKGKDGQYGFSAQSLVTGTNSISKNCKNPEAAIKLLDYLYTDEGSVLAIAGLKDIHYTAGPDGKFEKNTEEGTKAVAEKYMGLLSQLALNPTMDNEINKKRNPAYAYFIDAAAKAKLYDDIFRGYSTQESQTYKSDLNKFENEWMIKFIIGKEPLSKFDEYVKLWNEKGGKQIMESFVKEYNTRNGTKYTIGN